MRQRPFSKLEPALKALSGLQSVLKLPAGIVKKLGSGLQRIGYESALRKDEEGNQSRAGDGTNLPE
jgi:hypothetical protein